MKFKKPILVATMLMVLSTASGCVLLLTDDETIIDPVSGEIIIVPVTPREPYSGRGISGGGGWGG